MFEQKTLESTAHLRGIGLHTGEGVELELVPAPPDTGIVFVRTDLPGAPAVAACPENLFARPRRTALAKGMAEVQTPEHLLAALFGAGVHNLEVRLDGPEIPGLDGSALPFYEAVRQAGVKGQGVGAPEVRLRQPIAVTESGASLIAISREDGLSIGYTLDYGGSGGGARSCQGTQFLDIDITEESFAKEIAPARTFVFEEEIERLRAEGLGKGASTENTLVLGKDGVIGNKLRFRDELVRHKILDLIGDLYLTGSRLHGRLLATRSGHALNIRLARLIRENHKLDLRSPSAGRYSGNPSSAGGSTIATREIQEILPHRYPFLLVDRILQIEDGRSAIGLKNVTSNEPFFQGHFPGRPVMPGVLIVEAMAQLAGVVLRRQKEEAGGLVFLISLNHVKFRKIVEPGDQLILEAKVKKIRSNTAQMKATAMVGGAVAAEAEICFRILGP